MTAETRRPRGRPRTAEPDRAGGVQSLERALALLTALSRADGAGLSDLALRTGMPPSTAHRLLSTLQAARYVEFDEAESSWRVGVEAFRAGAAFLRRTGVVEAAREAMRRLVEETGETANVAVPDGGEVVFVSQVETSHPVRAFFGPGARSPMHASGIGKALLAAMPRDEAERRLMRTGLREFTPRTLTDPAALFADLDASRARGWAFDDEEKNEGMRCVAAPIFNAHGEPAAGLSISGPAARLPRDRVAEIGPLVRRAADQVTERLGGAAPARATAAE